MQTVIEKKTNMKYTKSEILYGQQTMTAIRNKNENIIRQKEDNKMCRRLL